LKILGVEIGDGGRARGERGQLAHLLERNSALRGVFRNAPAMQARLAELQQWQSQRLLRSHADLHANPRYRMATEYFFRELYGEVDPKGRDRDLIRVQHVMRRLLPSAALHALCLAIELEILSQELDAEVTRNLDDGPITDETYAEAYRRTNRLPDRARQIALIHEIGGYLDRVVRTPVIGALVRLARGPAHAAGFGALQEGLERGLAAFEAMHGAGEFLSTIRNREIRAMERLVAGVSDPFEFEARDRRGTTG
jgi:hypothetical protein